MTKLEFKKEAKKSGFYQAALFAAIAGVSLANVQLWLKSA